MRTRRSRVDEKYWSDSILEGGFTMNRRHRAERFIAVLGVLAPLAEPVNAADEDQAAGGSSLEEVIVTAQFRKENLQETPLAITAISADSLQARSLTSVADL